MRNFALPPAGECAALVVAPSSRAGIGAIENGLFGWFDKQHNAYRNLPLNEQAEVVSLVGDIGLVNGRPAVHIHAVVILSDGAARGGHMLQANVWEVFLTDYPTPLLKELDPETKRRYEVEVQLGPTDEAHIIRTIEYWDIERNPAIRAAWCGAAVIRRLSSRESARRRVRASDQASHRTGFERRPSGAENVLADFAARPRTSLFVQIAADLDRRRSRRLHGACSRRDGVWRDIGKRRRGTQRHDQRLCQGL